VLKVGAKSSAKPTKKTVTIVKMQLPAAKATPSSSLGSMLGPLKVNIPELLKIHNDRTKNQEGLIIPVVISVAPDGKFTLEFKSPPAAVLIKKACNVEAGSSVPNRNKVGKISMSQLRLIAEQKMPDLNAGSLEAATRMMAGSARSMGIEVDDSEV
jgi:large subunit ribosomal protein L11